MKIGLTYDLRSEYLAAGYGEEETAEFDREDTVAAIESSLKELGYATERIGALHRLVCALANGRRWDMVFNIAEGLRGIGREAQTPALLDAYDIPYTFSDPLVMSLTLHKGMTKRVVRDAGLATSDFAIIEGSGDLASIAFPPPYFVKPAAEGTGKGITLDSIVRHPEELQSACAGIIARYGQAALVEPYLSGREFTTGLVGTGGRAEVMGTMEIFLLKEAEQGVYSYSNKEHYEQRVEYRLVFPEADDIVREAESLALDVWRVLGCRDGGRIDLRCDETGRPLFMEVNPLAGLHPVHSDLPILCRLRGIAYSALIERIMHSAKQRIAVK